VSDSQPLPPDYLRRFTPTPYIFELQMNRECVRIEADDLEVALMIRNLCRKHIVEGVAPARFWRLIRDRGAPQYWTECEVVTAGALTTLIGRMGTVLIADGPRREIFGFLGAGLTMQDLRDNLIPRLLNIGKTELPDLPFTNK
jgi:hypothetical protein